MMGWGEAERGGGSEVLFQKRGAACATEGIGHEKGVEQNIKLETRTRRFITERAGFPVSAVRRIVCHLIIVLYNYKCCLLICKGIIRPG